MRYITLIILICLLSFCKNSSNKRDLITKRIERYKKIILPKINDKHYKSIKVSTFINGDCSVCIKELSLWKEWIVKDSNRIQFQLYFYSSDSLRYEFVSKKYFNIKYPLIYDKNSEYLSKNNIKKEDKMFQTFLLDKNDNVILIGNPLLNKKLAELYRREIDKRTKQ